MKWLALVLGFGLLCAAPSHAQDRGLTVQAICMDVRGVPHPASQTFAERDVAPDFTGELFRCLPGTAMRYAADSRNHDCAAGEALWYAERRLSCRAEAPLDTEQERDLLRQFGPGEKIVRLATDAAPAAPRDGPRIVNGYARSN
jgi:hypothetical protein